MSEVHDRIVIKAPAKVNLFLEILGKRSDGYHDIRSIIMPVSLCDTVILEATPGPVKVVMENDGLPMDGVALLPDDQSNLAFRAAGVLKDITGYGGGALIRIKKTIPIGGGLGGGSADAAAVLNGLNFLWNINMSKHELVAIGSKLGCDVPAMVHGGVVCAEGLGEKIRPLHRDRSLYEKNGDAGDSRTRKSVWWLVLANPGPAVSTGDIYSRYSSSLTSPPIPFNSVLSAVREGERRVVADGLFNSLQDTVFAKYPIIGILAESLKEKGADAVLLSGSGATLFAFARDREHADGIEESVSNSLGGPLWVRKVKTLPDGVTVAHGPLEA